MYKDDSLTFDRTDSFYVEKEDVCNSLNCRYNDEVYLLLQVNQTYWRFKIKITKENGFRSVKDYELKFVDKFDNFSRPAELITLRLVSDCFLPWRAQEVVCGFRVLYTFNCHKVYHENGKVEEKHIPLLKKIGLGQMIDSNEIFAALEMYFGAKKSAQELTSSAGLTDVERASNHGFNRNSFRGKLT